MEKLTLLPASREMWSLFDKKWEWLAMDKCGDIFLYTHKPKCNRDEGKWLARYNSDLFYIPKCLSINTDGIIWDQSLTKRPEGV